LGCNFINFVPTCINFDAFAGYRVYGVIHDELGKYGDGRFWSYQQKLKIDRVEKISPAPAKFSRTSEEYDCHSNSECEWIDITGCNDGWWFCLNKEMKDYFLEHRNWRIWGCNDVTVPKPSSSCTCQEGKCVG